MLLRIFKGLFESACISCHSDIYENEENINICSIKTIPHNFDDCLKFVMLREFESKFGFELFDYENENHFEFVLNKTNERAYKYNIETIKYKN